MQQYCLRLLGKFSEYEKENVSDSFIDNVERMLYRNQSSW